MLKKTCKVPSWWPELLSSWLQRNLTDSTISPADKTILAKIANDDRMKLVVRRLNKEYRLLLSRQKSKAHTSEALTILQFRNSTRSIKSKYLDFDNPLTAFISHAWQAPILWRHRKMRLSSLPSSRKRRIELAKFSLLCKRFAVALERQNDVTDGALQFSNYRWKIPADKEITRQRLTTIVNDIRLITENSSTATWGDDIDIYLSRKNLKTKNSEEIFCIRYLTDISSTIFGKPLHAEVADLVTVLLSSPIEIDKERVIDLWKSGKKWGANDIEF